VFFATWCPPCKEELSRLTELEARFGDRGYRLLIIAVSTRQSAERLAGFAAEHRLPGELLFDAGGDAERAWGVERLPTHIVLDASGREALRSGGLDATVSAAVERLLREGGGGRRGR
jgi:peroxiredoxin